MISFVPGNIIKTITSKKGKEIVIRYPQEGDLNELTKYINTLSSEDTYINYSGEVITQEEEELFLRSTIRSIGLGESVYLVATCENKIIGASNVDRNKRNRKRGLHAGLFGLTIKKEFRGQGIGYNLAQITIEEAKKNISNLKMIILECFACNTQAIGLYEKLGFKVTGKIPKMLLHKDEYFDEVFMAKEV